MDLNIGMNKEAMERFNKVESIVKNLISDYGNYDILLDPEANPDNGYIYVYTPAVDMDKEKLNAFNNLVHEVDELNIKVLPESGDIFIIFTIKNVWIRS